MKGRYQYLFELVRDLQPQHCVEIGTWTGKRASEWMAVSNCYYTGFDLFEEGTTEQDKAELNVKTRAEMSEVAKRLDTTGLYKYTLVRGDTKETLPKMRITSAPSETFDMHPFDFCFIDGGHSVETIKNDFEWAYENISEGGTIILDDFYKPEEDGFGCNFLEDKGEVIDLGDKYINGHVCLLKVTGDVK
jgi:predicted O-methyltransferase YrrM